MTAILRSMLLAALVTTSVPAAAAGQAPSPDSLLRRIDLLERRTAELEQRVRELEALIKVEPSRGGPVPDSRKWRDLASWRRLRLGMKMDAVRALLGEPETVEASSVTTRWRWDIPGGPEVRFDSRTGRLDGWSEPRQ
jgi:hypothetical protein